MGFLKAIGITAAVLLGLFLLDKVPNGDAPPQPVPGQVQTTTDPRWPATPSYRAPTDPRWPATPYYGSNKYDVPGNEDDLWNDDYDPDVERYEQNRDECANWYYC